MSIYATLKMTLKNIKMSKQTKKHSVISKFKRAPALVAAAVVIATGTSAGVVHASIQSQIDSLNAQNAKNKGSVSALQIQADNYQDAIKKLQSQIASIQGAIATNQAKQAKLQAQINAAQKKLDQQKAYLGEDLKVMYVNGDMSTVEMLATSKDLSDFVDAETYRGAVQTKIQNTLAEIAKLQNQLQDQKTQVQSLLDGEKAQQNQLASDRAQQASLLAMNESQQSAYNKKIKANNAEIAKLQAEQIAQNRAAFGNVSYGGTGSYPWPNAPCLNASGNCSANSESPYNWGMNGQPYDAAGWQYRNCTSYAFWRLAQARGITLTAGSFPNVSAAGGRIGYSIPDFKNLGYRVDHNPAGASLVVEGAGPYGPGSYGHIMYDEGGYVSQYNVYGDGKFSTMPVPSGSGYWFVHIP